MDSSQMMKEIERLKAELEAREEQLSGMQELIADKRISKVIAMVLAEDEEEEEVPGEIILVPRKEDETLIMRLDRVLVNTIDSKTKWSINDKQTVVQAQCSVCKIIYKDRQAQNDCIQAVGDYWVVGKQCLTCYMGQTPLRV